MGCGRAVWLSRLAQVLRRASRLCLLASSLLCPCQFHQPLQDGDVFDGDKRLGELGRGKADEGNSRAHNALPLFAAFLLSQAVGRVSGHGTLEESVYVAYKTRGSQTPSPRAHPPDKHVCDCGSCSYTILSPPCSHLPMTDWLGTSPSSPSSFFFAPVFPSLPCRVYLFFRLLFFLISSPRPLWGCDLGFYIQRLNVDC